jgi:predicted 3-demethylubiquinone-9 3-methyltransferase (glyoxalase superfamily)
MRAGGRVTAVTFELDGRQFYAFNGRPQFKFTEAISMFVDCETQEESTNCGRSCLQRARRAAAGGPGTSSACGGR